MLSYMPEGLSSFAGEIDSLMAFVYTVVGIWFIAAEFLLFWFIFSSRKVEGKRAKWLPGDTLQSQAWVLVPVFAVLFCDFFIEAKADPVWHHVKIEQPTEGYKVRITARQYMWLFTYPGADGRMGTADDITGDELHVPKDTKVLFELGSADVLHSFFVPELRLKQDAVPGRLINGWFDANREGTFEIACAEICGRNHTQMKSHLVVEGPEALAAWLASKK